MRKDEGKFITKFFSEAGTNEVNNDFFGYVQLDNYAIWVVTDGYDEEEGADIAARLAVEAAIEYFMARPRFTPEALKEIVNYVNDVIKDKQSETERYSLMHASMLIVISNYSSIMYANVGNTRMYHIREGYIISQTQDDSVAQLLVNEGALDMRDIKYHRQRNDLTQAIGDYTKINISKHAVPLQEGDVICLTTHGFWENIDEMEIETELSKYPDKGLWLKALEAKVIATSRDIVGNYTFASVEIEQKAPEPTTKESKKPFIKKVLIGLLIALLVILGLVFWNSHKKNKTIKRAQMYEQQAENSIKQKDFNNAKEEFNLAIAEYEKIKPKSKGFIGFITMANGKRAKVDIDINAIKTKIESTEKLQKAFASINEGNELCNANSFNPASMKYMEAKNILSDNSYMRDELRTEELLTTINTRIESSSKLNDAKIIEAAADEALKAGEYKLAKTKYEEVAKLFLATGKIDYVTDLERKITEISEKEQTSYNGAMLAENKGDVLAISDPNTAREAYYTARLTYQNLGDTIKTSEIDNKIQEINSKELADLQTANNLVQEGLVQLSENNPAGATMSFNRAKAIYQKNGDAHNSKMIDGYIKQVSTYVKSEEDTKLRYEKELAELQTKVTQSVQDKEKELAIQQELARIEKAKAEEAERQRVEEERLRKLQKAIDDEKIGDKQFILLEYKNSLDSYLESKRMYTELGEQESKIRFLDIKIKKSEGFFYEREGDDLYKEKKWKEAAEKYKASKDSFAQTDVESHIKEEVERKYERAMRRANKKWWEFWK